VSAYKEFAPPREFFEMHGDRRVLAALHVERTGGWLGLENTPTTQWRWSSGQSGLRFRNTTGGPLALALHGRIGSALDERRVRAFAGEAMVWSEAVTSPPGEFRFGCILPPGETTISFRTDQPPHHVGGDERPMAFRVLNLEIVVKPVAGKGS